MAKVEVTNVDKRVRVNGINFERDPSTDEAVEYKGDAWMRQWLKERGLRYIRVVNKKTKKAFYLFFRGEK